LPFVVAGRGEASAPAGWAERAPLTRMLRPYGQNSQMHPLGQAGAGAQQAHA